MGWAPAQVKRIKILINISVSLQSRLPTASFAYSKNSLYLRIIILEIKGIGELFF